MFFYDILRYMKPYRGDLERRGKLIKNYVFYDEFEWRYVPNHNESFASLKANNAQHHKSDRAGESEID